MGLGTTVAFALLAPGPSPGRSTWIALLGELLGGQVAIGALNELVDAAGNAAAKPWTPITAGLVSPRAARLAVALGLVAMAAGSAALGPVSLALCFLGAGAGLHYDLRFKRTRYAWLPYLVALPLLPTWVWAALGAFETGLLLLFALGIPATTAVHLAQAASDADADRAAGIRSPTTWLDPDRARRQSRALLLATALAAPLAADALGSGREIVAWSAVTAILVSSVVAVLERWLSWLGRRANVPCVASAVVLLAVGWIIGIRSLARSLNWPYPWRSEQKSDLRRKCAR